MQMWQHAYGLSRIVIIWNNFDITPIMPTEFNITTVTLDIVIPKVNSLLNRYDFNLYQLSTDAVMFLDDDISASSATIGWIFRVFKTMPHQFIGGIPRGVYRVGNEYHLHTRPFLKYSLVLPGMGGMVHKRVLQWYMSDKYLKLREYLLSINECDDLFLNLIFTRESGLPPVAIKSDIKLPTNSPGALSAKYRNRTAVRHRCLSWFEDTYGELPLRDSEYFISQYKTVSQIW